jgi:Ala-tRNA(Pro) deacylase
MDAELQSCAQIYVHPLVNDRTLGMSVDGLNAFFDKINVTVTWVDLTTTDV